MVIAHAFYRKLARDSTKHAFVRYAKMIQSLYVSARQIPAVCRPIRGFTASVDHKDLYCCIGTLSHHDYSVTYRESTGDAFIITDVELQVTQPLHHTFIVPHNLAKPLRDRITTLHARHRPMPTDPAHHFSPRFGRQYGVLAHPEHFMSSIPLLQQNVAHYISHLKRPYIIELHGTHLYMYQPVRAVITPGMLASQNSAACALAGIIESQILQHEKTSA